MGNYIPMIMREFYAAYGVILNNKRGMRPTKALIEPLDFVMIRGVSVDICAQKINNFYFRKEGKGDDDFSLKHTDYDERMKNPNDHIVWVASIIDKETPDWIDPAIGIHKNTLKNDTGVPQIDRIDMYIEPKQMVDYTQLKYASASFPASTSVLEVPAQTTETVPATSMATSSAPATGPGVPAYGMRLIRLDEAKVTKWVEEFPSYVKEAIEIDLVPHKENLEVVREEQKSIKEHLQAIELRLGRIEGGGEKGLSAIRAEL
ncbi:hypothetical protein RND71_035251 [Anisodus tanguticus]|uniref:Uncharacterized protein n=1 Tax=Anisodus tanguticus TaxID=243964 RepID=A0AAE1R4K4_9SOLA|nr:hypothetical protein RND71_035251 [Anisodus tanguticus]